MGTYNCGLPGAAGAGDVVCCIFVCVALGDSEREDLGPTGGDGAAVCGFFGPEVEFLGEGGGKPCASLSLFAKDCGTASPSSGDPTGGVEGDDRVPLAFGFVAALTFTKKSAHITAINNECGFAWLVIDFCPSNLFSTKSCSQFVLWCPEL